MLGFLLFLLYANCVPEKKDQLVSSIVGSGGTNKDSIVHVDA